MERHNGSLEATLEARSLEVHSKNILEIARRTARSYGATAHEADDVAQQLVVKFIRRWDDLGLAESRRRGSNAWNSYVARAARNAHIDFIRQNARRQVRERKAVGADESAFAKPSEQALPRDISGIEAYLARLAVIEASALLESERQRDVIRLVFIEGLSAVEVGHVLGIDSQTARLHLRNAVTALQAELSQSE